MKWTSIAIYTAAYGIAASLGASAGWSLAQTAESSDGPSKDSGTGMVRLVEPGPQPALTFTMHGSVDNLVPGQKTTLLVEVSNPNGSPLKLRTIAVTARNAPSGCRAEGNLRIRSYDSSRPHALYYTIPSHSSLRVPLTARLINAPRRNQDLCKDTVFRLLYTGTADAHIK